MTHFFYQNIDWTLELEEEVINWMQLVADKYERGIEELCFIFMNDEELLEMNKKHLKHDFYTDILTFDMSEPGSMELKGDMFISIDRVRENAENLKVPFIDELCRVMVHGVLHLIGYKDETDKQEKEMRNEEDVCLSLRMF